MFKNVKAYREFVWLVATNQIFSLVNLELFKYLLLKNIRHIMLKFSLSTSCAIVKIQFCGL